MNHLDLLSDTTYRQKAIGYLNQLLCHVERFPVKKSQIYGLRQIARQQPGILKVFAQHQGERALRKQSKASKLQTLKNLQAEIDFWILVFDLCGDEDEEVGYSKFNVVAPARDRCADAQTRFDRAANRNDPDEEVLKDLQAEIDFWTIVIQRRDTATPNWSVRIEADAHLPEELREKSGMSRRKKRSLKEHRKVHLERWDDEHIPLFFQRFCTHALYCLGMSDNSQGE